MSILVIADHDGTKISSATLNTIGAAAAIGGDIELLVSGSSIEAVAKEAAALENVVKVLAADDEVLAHNLAENLAPLIVTIAKNYSHILFSASSFGKNTAPRVAALLDVQQISDIISVEAADCFKRPIYAGNAIATVKSSDDVKVITVRGTAFDPVAMTGGSGVVEALSGAVDASLSSFVKEELTVSDRPELTSADIVISGGRGVGSAENFGIIESLADKMGAAIGASRAAVDAGYVPNDYQVGQTGKVVAPQLYIAVGISGAIQHLAGMKDSKIIVAINKDPDAPIFDIADYGIVGDLFDIVPELESKL